MAVKQVQLHDNQGVAIYPKTIGTLVFQVDQNGDPTNTQWCDPGAQVNVIETIKVNGTTQTVTNKTVDITVSSGDSYTMASISGSSSDPYSTRYYLSKNGTATAQGVNIDIPKDMVISSGSVVDITYNSGDGKLYDGAIDVTTLIVGSGTASAADAGKYLKLILSVTGADPIYISVKDLVDVYTSGDAIDITSNVISVKYADGLDVDNNNQLIVKGDGMKGIDVGATDGIAVKKGNGIDFDASGNVVVKLDTTNGSGLTVGANGLAVSPAQSGGIKIDGSGNLDLDIDSSSDFGYGSNGLHLKGENANHSPNPICVAYYTEI